MKTRIITDDVDRGDGEEEVTTDVEMRLVMMIMMKITMRKM
jgi:hypothetical protein